MDEQDEQREITTALEAADNALVLTFGRLQGAANRLEWILGRKIEEECGISHLMYEVPLILGRAGEPGLSMRAISQEQVLSTGGATRLVDRMEAAGRPGPLHGPQQGHGQTDRRARRAPLRRTGRTDRPLRTVRGPAQVRDAMTTGA
ncbi:MarR family transcriptional regulator [Streptomyces sp. NPDC006365]|uniref:MarR family transcriptional regulator n=1 Tax=Streptomyces sp. NPDC006365 TaxID=3364744 RepID=UPI0036960985